MMNRASFLFLAVAFSLFAAAGGTALVQKAHAGSASGKVMLAQASAPEEDNPAVRGKTYVPIQTAPTDLTLVAVGTVKEIIRSTLIKLEDGKVFTLINVRVPVYYEGPAVKLLKEKFVGKKVGVYQRDFPGVALADRYGNPSGHVVTENNEWIQATLVLKGMAWADSTPQNRDLVRKLYQYETLARTNSNGFWAAPAYAVKSAESVLEGCSNTFQVVEDVIKSFKNVGKDFLFNFGSNPAKDFTFTMPAELSVNFVTEKNQAFSPWKWVGQRVRVRGWVTYEGGALIQVNHAEQLEFVGLESRLQRR